MSPIIEIFHGMYKITQYWTICQKVNISYQIFRIAHLDPSAGPAKNLSDLFMFQNVANVET